MSTKTQKGDEIYEVTNINIDNLARWVFSAPTGGKFQWKRHIKTIATPKQNVMFSYKIPSRSYISVLSRRLVVNQQSKEYLAGQGMYKPGDTVEVLTGLDMFISDREDMADSQFISRFTIINRGDFNDSFLSVDNSISSAKEYDAKEHAETAMIVTVPVVLSLAIIEKEYLPLEKKKITRAQKRRAQKKGIPIIKQYQFDISDFVPFVKSEAKKLGENEIEVAMSIVSEKE